LVVSRGVGQHTTRCHASSMSQPEDEHNEEDEQKCAADSAEDHLLLASFCLEVVGLHHLDVALLDLDGCRLDVGLQWKLGMEAKFNASSQTSILSTISP
jgi:hypothetical protein